MLHITTVVFKKDKFGVVAVFPYEATSLSSPHFMSCYTHIGQHSSCTGEWIATTTMTHPDTDTECADLKQELIAIGYTLRVLKRIPRQASQHRLSTYQHVGV